MKPKTKITVITGPTASGKTSLSIAAAKKSDGAIICADSRIVYKNLDIVSAKPDEKEKEGIEHRLIDILEPTREFSAGDFVAEAKKAIKELKESGKNIIVSGGTWFYIKSLFDEKELPDCPINPELREELKPLDKNVLWEKLNSLDPKRATAVHPNNKDKVIRSIEMCLCLNTPISEYERKDNKNDFIVNWFMPDIEREILYERINKRTDIMIEKGLFREWERNKNLYPDSNILLNTIGYKEFFELEKGIYPDFETAVEKIKQHTRNFAKRQLTWFRSNKSIKPVKNVDEILKGMTC